MAYPDATTTTTAAVFIPELWSDEVIAAYKANLVLAGLVTNFNHQGKKGDTLNLPTPSRGAALEKAANTIIDPIQSTETDTSITITDHYYYARLIEDIVAVQGLDSLRQFYTDDAGFALATKVDADLHGLTNQLQGGTDDATWDAAVIGSDGSTAYTGTNEAAIADAGLRTVIQTLDDANVPQRDRVLVIPPVSKNTLLGLARFTEQAFVGEVGMANSIRNGRLGNVYGVEVFVSTQCPTATGAARIATLMHKSALGLVTQVDIRMQTQYKQEYLADLMTADTIYGTGILRADAGVAIAVVA